MSLRIQALLLVLSVVLLLNWLLDPVEQGRLDSPDGRHTAVITSLRLWQLLPGLPGQGGDRPGQVTIYDRQGRDLGTIRVGHISQAYQIRWLENGASIKLAGAWNFSEGFYAYWNPSQTQIVTETLD